MFSKEMSSKTWGAIFVLSTAALIFATYTHFEYLTLIIPFVTTAFVKALKIM
jgi:hypothetical protein